MFSLTATHLGLLKQSPSSGVLLPFDSKIQCGLVDLLCKQLFTYTTNIAEICTSDVHCIWVMEVVGAGLGLEIEQQPLISQCIDLYEMWFIRKENVPSPIEDNYLNYLESAVFQLTLVFKHTPSPHQHKIYEMLCKRVILMFQRLYQVFRSTSIEEKFCKILIGVVEDVVQSQNMIVMNNIIRLFYQVWTALNLVDNTVWKTLSKCHYSWVEQLPIASAWKETMIVIQNTVIQLLKKKSDECSFHLLNNNVSVTSTFKPQDLLKFWLKFMHLCGNICNIQSSEVHLGLVQGIRELVDSLIQTEMNGNDIMNLYGDILYQIIKYNNHITYCDSVCQSLLSLIHIFMKKYNSTQFMNIYTCQLYRSLSLCLTSESFDVCIFAIEQYCNIIDTIPPTNTILIADVISAIDKVVKKPAEVTVNIRSISLQLLHKIEFVVTQQRQRIQTTLNKFSIAQPMICSIFNICFDMLKVDPVNIDDVFIALSRFIIASFYKEAINFIEPNVIINKFITSLSKHCNSWLAAASNGNQNKSLLDFMLLLLQYPKYFSPSVLKDVLLLIESYLEFINEIRPSTNSVLQVYSSYFTYCYFELNEKELFNSSLIIDKLMKIQSCGNVSESFGLDIEMISLMDRLYFAKTLHNNDSLNEENLKKEFTKHDCVFEDYIHVLYLFQKVVISFIELPWKSDKVIVIIRTRYGKNVFGISYQTYETNWTLLSQKEVVEDISCGELPITNCNWITNSCFNINKTIPNQQNHLIDLAKDMNNGSLQPPISVDRINPSSLCFDSFNHCFITRMLCTVLGYSHPLKSEMEQFWIVYPHALNLMLKLNQVKQQKEYVQFLHSLGEIETIETIGKSSINQMHFESQGNIINYHVDILNDTSDTIPRALINWGTTTDASTKVNETCELVINIIPTHTELYLIQSNQDEGLLLPQQLCSYDMLPDYINSSLLLYSRLSLAPRYTFETRSELLLTIGSFIESEYTSVAVNTLFNKKLIRKTEPFDFKTKSVFDSSFIEKVFGKQIPYSKNKPSNEQQRPQLSKRNSFRVALSPIQTPPPPQNSDSPQTPQSSTSPRKSRSPGVGRTISPRVPLGQFKRTGISGRPLSVEFNSVNKKEIIEESSPKTSTSPIIPATSPIKESKIDRNIALAPQFGATLSFKSISPLQQSDNTSGSGSESGSGSDNISPIPSKSPTRITPIIMERDNRDIAKAIASQAAAQVAKSNTKTVQRNTFSYSKSPTNLVTKSPIEVDDSNNTQEAAISPPVQPSPSPKRGRFIGRRTMRTNDK
ncbi:Ral GTPase-activating protein subunit alpha/beta N-terminal domain-containing protein [Entamoeba marina]